MRYHFLSHGLNFRSFGNNDRIGQVLMMWKIRQTRKMWRAVITKHQTILLILTMLTIIQMHEILIIDDYCFMNFQQIPFIKP